MNLKEYCQSNKIEHLLMEWDFQRNDKWNLSDLDAASHRKVWWKCAKGHEWQAEVKDRTYKQANCPYCGGKKVLAGFNDLKTLAPLAAAEWHPTKNGELCPEEITAGSEKKVWWQCEKGHEWQATIENRALKGNACPYCTGRKAWPGYNDLETLYPKIARQWHPSMNQGLHPSTVRPGCGKKVWWICNEGHVWEARVFSRTSKAKPGCPVCAGNAKKMSLNERSSR